MALLPNALSGHVHSPVPHKRSPDRSGKTILTPLPLSSTAPSLLQAQTPSPNPSFSLSPSLIQELPFSIWNLFPPGNCLCDWGAGDSLCRWFRFWQWNAPPCHPHRRHTHPLLREVPSVPQGFTHSARVWVKCAVGVFRPLSSAGPRSLSIIRFSFLSFFLFFFLNK